MQRLYPRTSWSQKVAKCGIYRIMGSITHIKRISVWCLTVHRRSMEPLCIELLQGPDLTNKLIGVMLRLRQHPITLMTDIEGMFHQVRVAREDVDFLRFLWWSNGVITKELVEHRMTVHIFGAVLSQ